MTQKTILRDKIIIDSSSLIDIDELGGGELGLGYVGDGSGWAAYGIGFKGGSGAGSTAGIACAGNTLYMATGNGTNNNSLINRFDIRPEGVVINDTGAISDFRVESDNKSHMLFVDAVNDRVGINTNSPLFPFHVNATANLGTTENDYQQIARFEGTNGNDSKLDIIQLREEDGSSWLSAATRIQQSIDSTEMGYLQFNGTGQLYGVSIGSSGGSGGYHVASENIRFNGSGIVVNEDGLDRDFRIESNDNDHMLFVNAGDNRVAIGGSSTSSAVVNLQGGGTALETLWIYGQASGKGGRIVTIRDTRATSGTEGSAGLRFTSGPGTDYVIGKYYDGSLSQFMITDQSGNEYYTVENGAHNVFNQGGSSSKDFRVESGNSTHALFVDADTGNVGIRVSSPSAALDVSSNGGFRLGSYHTTNQYFYGGYYHGYSAQNVTRYTIAEIYIDYNDWNSVGTLIVELSEKYYGQGGFATFHVRAGYVSSYTCDLVQANGAWNGASVNLGTPVQVSGDWYKLPVYVDCQGYFQFTGRITTTHQLKSDQTTGHGIYLFSTPPKVDLGTTSVTTPNYIYDNHSRRINGYFETRRGAHINYNSEDSDFQVESDTKTHALFVQGSNGHVGINTANPSDAHVLTVGGNIKSNDAFCGYLAGWNNSSSTSWRVIRFSFPDVSSSGTNWTYNYRILGNGFIGSGSNIHFEYKLQIARRSNYGTGSWTVKPMRMDFPPSGDKLFFYYKNHTYRRDIYVVLPDSYGGIIIYSDNEATTSYQDRGSDATIESVSTNDADFYNTLGLSGQITAYKLLYEAE
jgi:hypothetical protein